ncbi:MAG: hypothetical protein ACLTV6_01035 [Christensenellales bacterium]
MRSGYFNQSERIGRAERTGDGWRTLTYTVEIANAGMAEKNVPLN